MRSDARGWTMMLRFRRNSIRVILFASILSWQHQPLLASNEWPPVTAEDLALKDVPGHEHEHAVILLRQEDTDDPHSLTHYHYRIKILAEEGRKFADIEIPYWKQAQVDEIQARTIRPDGSVAIFAGTIYDKTVLKSRGVRISVKSFTFPEADPGNIIEYRYRRKWPHPGLTVWKVQDVLFTRHALFSIKPLSNAFLHYQTHNLSDQLVPERQQSGIYEMRFNNLPAFTEEEFMPPVAMVKPTVEFFYQSPYLSWGIIVQEFSEAIDKFVGKPKKLEGIANEIAAPSESAEQRLRKFYARAQQIRNLDFEARRSEKESKQENLKENGSAEEVLKRGHGTGRDINLLLLALARAAGFEANEMRIATRDGGRFDPSIIDPYQLNASVVQVKAEGKVYYLDPATRFCPFGLLSWNQTASNGILMRPAVSLGSSTPVPLSADAVLERRGLLDLGPDGALNGKLQVTFHGQEALQRRLGALEMTGEARMKSMEKEITDWLPVGASLKVEPTIAWESSEESLKVEATLSLPNFATTTARRLLLPVSLFQQHGPSSFSHPTRTYPIFFPYAFQEIDAVRIRVPDTFQIESVPPPVESNLGFGAYRLSVSGNAPEIVTIDRRFVLEKCFFTQDSYASIRSLFAQVRRKGDEQQIVLQAMR